jgi:hypothetical protein
MSEFISFAPHEDRGGYPGAFEDVKEAMDAEKTLMYALEQAGVIRPAKEMAAPIDRIITEANEPAAENSEFIIRRDQNDLENFRAEEAGRNKLQQRITRLINELQTYDADQRRALRNWGKWYSAKHGVPPVQEELKRLILPERDDVVPAISEDASEYAPDVYWMMLREDEDAKKNAAELAAV